MLQDDEVLEHILQQTQTPHKTQSKQFSMVTVRHSRSLYNPKNDTDCCVFPPVNHENLQVPSPHNNLEQHHPSSNSSSSLSLSSSDLSPKEVMIGWLDYGLEVLRAKICGIISFFCDNDGANKGALGTFGRVAGMAMVVIWWWLYRRRRSQRETVEHLKLVIKEKDEKILQLLRQIAQMNEVLVGRHKALALKPANQ